MKRLLVVLILLAASCFAQVSLSPVAKQIFFGSTGSYVNKPLASGYIYTYYAGTTTPLATYTDSAGLSPNTNPIRMNAAGYAQDGSGNSAEIWLTNGQSYKFVVTDADGVQQWTADNVKIPAGGSSSYVNILRNGTIVGSEPGINFIDSSNVTWTATDNGANNRVDLTATVSNSGVSITSPQSTLSIGGTSTNPTLDVVGASGYILAGPGPGLTTNPTLGEDGVTNGMLTLSSAAGSAHTTIATQATSSWTFKFPINAGTNAYVLQTDGSGNTSWVPPTSGGTGCTPIGSSGDLQTNNGSGGCGASHINDNGTTMTVTESITPSVASAKNLGTAPLPFGDGYFGGAANHSFHFDTSAIASNVAVAIPNATSNTVQGIANPSDTNVINYIDASGVQHRIAQSGGGDTITSPYSTINVSGTSSNTHLDVVGAAGYILAGPGPGLTTQPTIGEDGVTKGLILLANDTAVAHTSIGTQATSSWTFKFPATAGTSGQFLKTDGSGNTSWANSSSAPQGYSFSGVTTFTIPGATHGLGTKYLILQCYDNANPANFILPAFTVNPSTYDVIVTFTTATSGYCVLI